MKISRPQLNNLIVDIIAQVPETFRRYFENLEFTIEDAPPPSLRKSLGLQPGEVLIGLYQGIPRIRRGSDYGNVLPDKITIYQGALEDLCPDPASLQHELEEVVLHEIGHYFGLSEAELARLAQERSYHAIKRRKMT